MDNRSKRWLGNLGMLCAPTLAMFLAIWWMSPSARLASAEASTPIAVPEPAPVPVVVTLSPEEQAARAKAEAYATSLRSQAFGPTPMYYDPVTPNEPTAAPKVLGAPSLNVQMIMATSGGAKALINGKVYREGDDFEDGWVVMSIDSNARSVTIADSRSERMVTESVRMPGEH